MSHPRLPHVLRSSAIRGARLVTVVVSLVLLHAAPSMAATKYWDTTTTSGIQAGTANWGSADWAVGNGTTLTNWTSGDAAIFNGNGPSGVTVSTATTANSVWIGSSAGNGANVTVNYNSTSTLSVVGSGQYFMIGYATGGGANTTTATLNQYSGTINPTSSGTEIGRFGTSGTLNLYGGTFNVANILRIANQTGGGTVAPSGTLNISGGTLNNTGSTYVGYQGAAGYTATGTMIVGSGLFNGKAVVVANGTYTKGTITLDGGTLQADSIASVIGGNSTFNFNGGTLQPNSTAAASFMSGLTYAYVKSGGAIIDTTNAGITIAQALLDPGGGGGLTKLGGNTLTLSGANTYPGKTVVNAGTLSLGSDGNLGAVPAGVVADQLTLNGATLRTTASFTLSATRGITLSGGGTFDVQNSSSITLTAAGIVTGSGTLTKTGPGRLFLSNAANDFTGNIAIANGILNLNAGNGALGNAANNIFFTGNGTLQRSDGGTVTLPSARDITINNGFNGTFDVSNTSGIVVNSVIGGGGGLSTAAAGTPGTLTLAAVNTYTGTTTLASGTLNLGIAEGGGGGPLGNGGTIALTGGTLQYSSLNAYDYSGRFSTAGSPKYNVDTSTRSVTWASPLVSGGSLAKFGAGTLTLTNPLTNTGLSTTAIEGLLQLNGGTLTGTGAVTIGDTAANGMVVLSNTSQLGTTGSYDLVVGGGANSLTGTLLVHDNARVNVGGNLTVGKGTTGDRESAYMTVDGSGAVVTVTNTLKVTNSGDNGWGSAALNVLAGSVAANVLQIHDQRQKGDNATVTVKTAGTLRATSGVVFTGNDNGTSATTASLTIDTGGILQTSGITGIPDTANGPAYYVLTLSGGTVEALANNTNFISGFANTDGSLKAPVIGAAGITIDSGSWSIGIPQPLTGAGGLTKTGSGTLTLSGSNAFTGVTEIDNGTLILPSILTNGSTQPLGKGSSAILLGSDTAAGALQYTGGAATLGRNVTVSGAGGGIVRNTGGAQLTLSGTLTKDGRVLTLTGSAGSSILVTGKITGPSAGSDLNVDGISTTLANPANDYNGPTYVYNGGTLQSAASNVLPNATTVVLGDGATSGIWDLQGYTDTVAGLTFNGGTLRFNLATGGASARLVVSGTVDGLAAGAVAVNDTPDSSVGKYILVTGGTVVGGSIGGTAPTGYRIVVSPGAGGEVDLQHQAVQTMNSPTPATMNILLGGSLPVGATLSNTAPAESADLVVNPGDGGSSRGALGSFSGSGPVGPGSSLAVGAVFTATSYGPGAWSLQNADPDATVTTIATGGTVNVGWATANNGDSITTFGTPLTGRAANGSYAGLASMVKDTAGTGGAGKVGSEALLLWGAATGDPLVSMKWRTQTQAERTGSNLFSDVVDLRGITAGDTYVLQMDYQPALLPGGAGDEASWAALGKIFLGRLEGASWVNAGLGDTPTLLGPWNSSYETLGQWGIDTANHHVWAVLDSDGAFAVVPEPGTLALMACGLAAIASRLRLSRGRRKTTRC